MLLKEKKVVYDVAIVGAGSAGLVVAKTLSGGYLSAI